METMPQQYEGGSPFAPTSAPKSAAAEAIVSRQAQEVQAAMVIAKRFPRDEHLAYTKIMTACQRKLLAENAEYEYPRGSEKVSGPSIRLAEVLAQHWGNMDYGVMELEQKNGESQCMAYAWDLETNTRRSMIFSVKHMRHTKKGAYALSDPRDIYELVANQGARRVRACILGIIPGDVVEAAQEQCRKTIINGEKRPLKDLVREIIVAFEENFQVTQAMLEKYIGCKADAFSINDYIRLKNVGKTLRDGMGKREDYFDIPKVESNFGKTKAEEEFEKAQAADAAQSQQDGQATKDGDSSAKTGQPELSFE